MSPATAPDLKHDVSWAIHHGGPEKLELEHMAAGPAFEAIVNAYTRPGFGLTRLPNGYPLMAKIREAT